MIKIIIGFVALISSLFVAHKTPELAYFCGMVGMVGVSILTEAFNG